MAALCVSSGAWQDLWGTGSPHYKDRTDVAAQNYRDVSSYGD
jgi:hypothetical protein